MAREKFGSRLGFLLISAGCAIGIGNVWKFPYITGQYGGAAFVLIFLFGNFRNTAYDNGVCGRSCLPKELCLQL